VAPAEAQAIYSSFLEAKRPPSPPSHTLQGARSSSVAAGSVLTTRAGLPTATDRGGTSLVTTEPAPIVEPSPMVTPGRMIAPPPIQQSAPMTMALAASLPVATSKGSSREGQ